MDPRSNHTNGKKAAAAKAATERRDVQGRARSTKEAVVEKKTSSYFPEMERNKIKKTEESILKIRGQGEKATVCFPKLRKMLAFKTPDTSIGPWEHEKYYDTKQKIEKEATRVTHAFYDRGARISLPKLVSPYSTTTIAHKQPLPDIPGQRTKRVTFEKDTDRRFEAVPPNNNGKKTQKPSHSRLAENVPAGLRTFPSYDSTHKP